jgi:homocysteine S-methyltransferase
VTPGAVLPQLEAIIASQGVVVLDGGLATELERRGLAIDDPLWSAKVLCEQPQAIEQLHFDYLAAGADCIITSSYQATLSGLALRDIGRSEALEILLRSVALAQQARRRFLAIAGAERPRPLIAASIGPYGAMLHDGSEYRGNYGLLAAQLVEFHCDRFAALAASEADLIAFETIPSFVEAEALLRLLREHPAVEAWFSFSCRNGTELCDGTPIRSCAELLNEDPQVVALGVNCTPPSFIEPLIVELRRSTGKQIVVYPNSGEVWDAMAACWRGHSDPGGFADLAVRWHRAGAQMIGGCCRTGPDHIRALAQRLKAAPES